MTSAFGHGFDTRHLHQIRTVIVIQWKSLEIRGLTIVFAFYREFLKRHFSPFLYVLSICVHPLVELLVLGILIFMPKCGMYKA